MKTHGGGGGACMCGRRGETRGSIARFMNRRAPAKERYQPTDYEHAANCVTHALWIVPSALGSVLLHGRAAGPLEGLTACVYGLGLCALFTVSTLFHTVSWRKSHLPRVEQCFHMFDRVTIYFFIAASYAPWLNLRELGPWAAHMRWLVWVMACAGTVYVCLYHERYKLLELLCYATMGLCPALVILSSSEQEGMSELALGGALYAMGVVFFKSDGLVPFAHAIWHVFVVLGATVHYFAIWRHLYRRGDGVGEVAVAPLGVRAVWDF